MSIPKLTAFPAAVTRPGPGKITDPELTPLESAVLDKLLTHPGEPFDTIRTQVAHASVSSREFTGVGFFTNFALPADAPIRRDLASVQLRNVAADITGMKNGAGFTLFVAGGQIDFLEGFSDGEPWLEKITDFNVFER